MLKYKLLCLIFTKIDDMMIRIEISKLYQFSLYSC